MRVRQEGEDVHLEIRLSAADAELLLDRIVERFYAVFNQLERQRVAIPAELDSKGAAEYLSMPYQTFRKRLHLIPHVKRDGRLRFKPADLDTYRESNGTVRGVR
jgi:hypothetical protein